MPRICEKCSRTIKDGMDGVDGTKNMYTRIGAQLEIYLRGPGVINEYEIEHSWKNSTLCPKCGKELFDLLHNAGLEFIYGKVS